MTPFPVPVSAARNASATAAIQAAIDAAHAAGGGTVVLAPGTYRTGTLFLKSRVTLHLETGATLLGSPDLADYPQLAASRGDITARHLLVARNARHIALTGGGTIDGNGPAFWEPTVLPPNSTSELDRVLAAEPDPDRAAVAWIPHRANARPSPMIDFSACAHVRIEGVTITNSAGWNLHVEHSRFIAIRGVHLAANLRGPNNDGFDIDGCADVTISDCNLSCCDDAICLKTETAGHPCERVAIANCVIRSRCAALKLGWSGSRADFRHITMTNCVIYESHRGVALYSVEGGVLEQIAISNITFDSRTPLVAAMPIHMDVRRRRPESQLGKIRDVSISNFIARTDGRIVITADPGAPPGTIDTIVLRDIQMRYPAIEDIAAIGAALRSAQFSQANKEAMAAPAALVADNVDRLLVENFITEFPATNAAAAEWSAPVKGANGQSDFFARAALYPDPPPAFARTWTRRLRNSRV